MKIYYDFHIHSALSTCADDDMTPNNIINMAKIKGLDAIAVTDHNSTRNLAAVLEAADRADMVVIPGMEVQTIEMVHIICLFPDLKSALEVGELVARNIINKPNDAKKYGKQILLNSYDEIIGYEEISLLSGTTLKIDELADAVEAVNGIAIPAHINRKSYSILTKFGEIPERFKLVEVTCDNYKVDHDVIRNSDAHSLGNISERHNFLEVEERNSASIIKNMKKR